MKGIQEKFKLKWYKIENLDMYLGAELSKMANVDGQECWAMSSDKYCMIAVTNVEYFLYKRALRLPPKCATIIRCDYCTDMYVTGDLRVDGVQWY